MKLRDAVFYDVHKVGKKGGRVFKYDVTLLMLSEKRGAIVMCNSECLDKLISYHEVKQAESSINLMSIGERKNVNQSHELSKPYRVFLPEREEDYKEIHANILSVIQDEYQGNSNEVHELIEQGFFD